MLTAEQKEARKLGGSMIAAAVGLSRYKTPLDAYQDILHLAPEQEENPHMERGTFLEPAIRTWTNHRLGALFEPVAMPLVHPGNSWFTFSPDGLEASAGKRVLEIKAPGPFAAAEWGEPGTDNIPAEYHLQVDWGLAVCDRQEGVVAALIGGELRIFKIVRDLDLERRLIDKATAFINNYVVPQVPPPAQYGDEKTLRAMYPRAMRPDPIAWNDLNSMQQQVVADYLRLHAAVADAEKEKGSKEVLVQDIIKDAPGIAGLPESTGYTRIDWRESKPAMHAGSWKSLAESLLQPLPEADQQQLKQNFTPEVGTRRFTPIKIKATR